MRTPGTPGAANDVRGIRPNDYYILQLTAHTRRSDARTVTRLEEVALSQHFLVQHNVECLWSKVKRS